MFKSFTLLFALLFGVVVFGQNFTPSPTPATETQGQMIIPFAPLSMTITENSDPVTIVSLNSVSCNAGGLHADNSYFRAFTLSSFGINDEFDINSVQIGVEQAVGAGGSQPVTCKLYTSSQTFPNGYPGSLTLIGQSDEMIPDQSLTLYSFSVSGAAPAGSILVVEIFTPDGQTAGNSFFIGSNTAAETAPSYIMAADCGLTVPTPTANIGWPDMHIVMSVTGDVLPVELSSFSAFDTNGDVTLQWTTSSELNNSGFEIQKSTGGNYFTIGFVKGQGTTTESHSYSFVEKNAAQGIVSYRLKQNDLNGSYTYSEVVTLNVDAPASYQLTQNYPNPFNPTTQISFGLPVDAGVKITIYNALGQQMTQLVNQNFTAGNHNVNFNASSLSSGLYFYVLQANGVDGSAYTSTKKMMLMK